MRSIFNSLGSNYSTKFVVQSLWSIFFSRKSDLKKLKQHILNTYAGDDISNSAVLSFYKGRDAIEAACKVLLKRGDQVITQAFSCYAVEEGIVRAGMKPVYVDISEESTNLTIENLEKVIKQYPMAKAVLVQHSLGIAANSGVIRKWCKQHNLLFFEDLAQGIGGFDEDGNILGLKADAVIFSFGKDKIIDAVSGGAVLFKGLNDEVRERLIDVEKTVKELSFFYVYEDLLYPDITSFIRRTHHFGLGKLIFVICKYFGLLGSPIVSKTDGMTFMHPSFAKLALMQFKNLENQIEHRKRMARGYYKQLSRSKHKFLINSKELERSSNLRFNIRCSNLAEVEKLLLELKKNRIYVSDRWYRKAVDCGNFVCETAYMKGSCANAENLATQVLNLPTHREINLVKVKKICKVIESVFTKN